MGCIVIACYKPKPGKVEVLTALMRNYLARLRHEGLATSRASLMMTAGDGTLIEAFEWASREAKERAHENTNVKAMADEIARACEFVALNELDEASHPFAEFSPVD
ncbi:MAG TPA: hypothetical protein VMW31_06525 [Devosiaceae bacterium]|nr:hypothetical protein [Devosiaceae bacterium]